MCVTLRETHLHASDIGVIHIEVVVTNGAPLAVMVNLQPTAGIGTIAEAEGTFGITNALNTHVFVMTAIVAAPSPVIALINPIVLGGAAKVIHVD
jgi:enoyl-CoA hydratase/carnithine racemase